MKRGGQPNPLPKFNNQIWKSQLYVQMWKNRKLYIAGRNIKCYKHLGEQFGKNDTEDEHIMSYSILDGRSGGATAHVPEGHCSAP